MKKAFFMVPAVAMAAFSMSFITTLVGIMRPSTYYMPGNRRHSISFLDTDYNTSASKKEFSIDSPEEEVIITPPEIHVKEDIPCLSTNTVYTVEDFARASSDCAEDIYMYFDIPESLSGEEISAICIDGEDKASIEFQTEGTYTITVCAMDDLGGITKRDIKLQADSAPYIICSNERYIKTGSEFDPSEYIIALDTKDGIISDSIYVEDSSLDTSTEGAYELIYEVKDSNGLVSQKSVTVYVGDENRTLEPISTEDMELLCDAGYFSYEPLEEENYDAALEMVTPSLINVKKIVYSNGEGYSGSGFIYSITSDYIYFVSVAHVTNYINKDVDLMFYNKTVIKATYEVERINDDNEIVMFRIPTDDIPVETLLSLKQVYSNERIYDNMTEGYNIFAYSPNWRNESPALYTRQLMEIDVEFRRYSKNCIKTTKGSKRGMSGTASFDYKGNLTGVCDGSSRSYSLDAMITGMEELYHRMSAE